MTGIFQCVTMPAPKPNKAGKGKAKLMKQESKPAEDIKPKKEEV